MHHHRIHLHRGRRYAVMAASAANARLFAHDAGRVDCRRDRRPGRSADRGSQTTMTKRTGGAAGAARSAKGKIGAMSSQHDSAVYLGIMDNILSNPEDDSPRLILADWLDERGQPGDAERAEFIRVQCVLATYSPPSPLCVEAGCGVSVAVHTGESDVIHHPDCRWAALQARAAELLKLEVNWIHEVPKRIWTAATFSRTWQRGFISALNSDAAEWAAAGFLLLRSHPVEELTLGILTHHAPEMLALEHIRKSSLRQITLRLAEPFLS